MGPETNALLDTLVGGARALVPAIWRWEMANLFVSCQRRRRVTREDVTRMIAMLNGLPIDIDPNGAIQAWDAVLPLAADHALSAYDASYLELALRAGLPLATRDIALARAAGNLGVPLALSP